MGAKAYAIYDRVYMLFGSIMNSCQHIITDHNKKELVDWAWNTALFKTAKLVDELYKKANNLERVL